MPNMPRQPKVTALNVDQHPVHNMIHVLMLMRGMLYSVSICNQRLYQKSHKASNLASTQVLFVPEFITFVTCFS